MKKYLEEGKMPKAVQVDMSFLSKGCKSSGKVFSGGKNKVLGFNVEEEDDEIQQDTEE